MLVDQGPKLSDQLPVPAQRQLVLDSLLPSVQAQLIQARRLADRERLAGEVGQRRPTPHVQGPRQKSFGLLRRCRLGRLDEMLELGRVQLVR